jgi:hypothetical protein
MEYLMTGSGLYGISNDRFRRQGLHTIFSLVSSRWRIFYPIDKYCRYIRNAPTCPTKYSLSLRRSALKRLPPDAEVCYSTVTAYIADI